MKGRGWVLEALVDGPRYASLAMSGRWEQDLDVLVAVDAAESGNPLAGVGGTLGPFRQVVAPWRAVVDRREQLRWRYELGDRTFFHDGVRRVVRGIEAQIPLRHSVMELPGTLQLLVEPVELVALFEIGEPVAATAAGREAVSVIGARRAGRARSPGAALRELGDRVRLVLDADRGLILRWQSWFRGFELAEVSVDEVDFDGTPDEALFAIPPAPPRPRRWHPMPLPMGPPDGPDGLRARADRHPQRREPDDRSAAEAAIQGAVTGIFDVSPDGADAVNVEGGAGLGPAIGQVRKRFAGMDIEFVNRLVRFVDVDEAVVYFDVRPFPLETVETRVVRVGEHWLVDRESVARLLHNGGAAVPPPDEEPPAVSPA